MDHISELRRSIKEVEGIVKEGDKWRFDEEPLDVFEKAFASVLEGRTIREIVSDKKEKLGHVRAANLLGGKRVLEELGVSEGVAVRLLNKTDGEDEGASVKILPGNVLNRSTWEKIPDNQDLILSLGRAAYIPMPSSSEVWYSLLNRSWHKLADNGIMLLQANMTLEGDLEKVKLATEKAKGIRMKTHTYIDEQDGDTYVAVMIERGRGAPADFPTGK